MSITEEQQVETVESEENTSPEVSQEEGDSSETEETTESVETEEELSSEAEEVEVTVEEPPKAEEPTLDSQLADMEKRLRSKDDQFLRLNAEFENYKRRMTKENADRLKYYHIGLVKELLPALDSLERAIEHGQKENTTVEAILEGIQMVYKLNQEALEKFSIKKIKAVGEAFDPSIHQAVGTVESEEIPEDHVVDEFQVGYLLHDRVVRPAMVRVSKKQ